MICFVIHSKITGKPCWFDAYTGKFYPGLRRESAAYRWAYGKQWSFITNFKDIWYEHTLIAQPYDDYGTRMQLNPMPDYFNDYELRPVKGFIGGMDFFTYMSLRPTMALSDFDETNIIYDNLLPVVTTKQLKS